MIPNLCGCLRKRRNMESEDMIIFDPLGELLKIAEEIKKEKEREEQK